MTSIACLGKTLRQLFEQDARTLARSMGVIQRERKLTGTQLALLLVLGWWHQPTAGSSALSRFAASLGIAISKQGIEGHFRLETAQWLYELLLRAIQRVIRGPAVAIPLLRRFTAVYVEDGSTISLPDALVSIWRGCRGGNRQHEGTTSAVKLTVRLDMLHGTIEGPHLQDGRRHESQSLLHDRPMAKGSLWIADAGYFALVKLVALSKAGMYFLMPYKDSVVLWFGGQRTDVLTLLEQQGPASEGALDVILGASKQVPCRLLARRLSEAEVAKRHQQQDEYARKHGKVVTQRQRDLAHWSLLISNVPTTLMTVAQAWILMRMRWQIELLWKLWKMQGLVDEWQTQNPDRILCEVYAKLLGLLIQHWVLLLSCWEDPHRSWINISEVVRDQVTVLAHGFSGHLPLGRAVRLVCRTVAQASGCSIPARTHRASTSHRLLSCQDDALT